MFIFSNLGEVYSRMSKKMICAWLILCLCLAPVLAAATAEVPAEVPDEVKREPSYRLQIDVTNQFINVFWKTPLGNYVLYKQIICSTGLEKTRTPLGSFVLPDTKRYKWAFFPEFDVYAQYLTRINGAILFHSILYSRQNINRLKTTSYRNLGTRASHGCVRLLVEDAKWIYEHIEPGTICDVYEGEKTSENAAVTEALKPPALDTWYPISGATPETIRIHTPTPRPSVMPTLRSMTGKLVTNKPTPTPRPTPTPKGTIEETPAPAPEPTPAPAPTPGLVLIDVFPGGIPPFR